MSLKRITNYEHVKKSTIKTPKLNYIRNQILTHITWSMNLIIGFPFHKLILFFQRTRRSIRVFF